MVYFCDWFHLFCLTTYPEQLDINPRALWNLNENCLSLKASNAEKQFPELCLTAAAAAKSRWSCPTLCNPIDGSLPGSAVPGILQARTLEWVAISFSSAGQWKVKVKSLSCVYSATPWTAAYQAPPSMGFSRQEYWSGLPLSSPCGPPKGLFLPKADVSPQKW